MVTEEWRLGDRQLGGCLSPGWMGAFVATERGEQFP